MRCHNLVLTAVVLLFLSGCGSNQPANTDVSQPNSSRQSNIHNAVDTIQEPKSPTVPIDGRLRDEHLQMYVSVRIKQEQLRYKSETENAANYISNTSDTKIADAHTNAASRSLTSAAKNSSALYEKQAVEDFEFNRHLYFWAKQTIVDTLARAPIGNALSKKRASNFEEYVVTHNLRMIEKYRDQLRFAENYKLHPLKSIVHHAAQIGPEVADQPKALILLPSS
jgi:hypothetical protein